MAATNPVRLCLAMLFVLLALPLTVAAQSEKRPDVRVLIDVSGSMRQNDPRNLRRPALELLVQLFPANARGGVWTFGHEVKPLVAHAETTPEWRHAARPLASRIGSNELFTDIPAALSAAAGDLGRLDPAYQQSIILLTDGKVDISRNAVENLAARRKVLETQLPALRAAGVKVHTIALSKEADSELMERLAVDTGGLFAIAETPEALNRVFLKVFDAAAPAEQLPIEDNRFQVDAAIDELTVLVFHGGQKPLALRSPSRTFEASSPVKTVRWFSGKGYDLITVQKPEAGGWQIDATLEEGSRVTIVSDLSLGTRRLPGNLFVRAAAGGGEAAQAALLEQGELLQRPELLKLVSFSATVQRGEDGEKWETPLSRSDDGWYRAALPMLAEAGTYEIAIDADGKTFQRSQRQTVAVREAFDVQSRRGEEQRLHLVTLFARNPDIDGIASEVTAIVVAADGSERRQALTAGDGRSWPLEIETPPAGGRLQVTFEVAGRYRNGDRFNYRSGTVTVDAEGESVLTAAPPPQPVAAPEPKADPGPAAPAEPAAAPAGEAAPAWKTWALYGGIALGNLLLIALGYFAFRKIMGSGKSSVLEEPDEEESEEPPPATGKRPAPSLDALDLPIDAIDIDPAADKKR